jgi:CPA2 family monovalent cation:H+ antiporter-2
MIRRGKKRLDSTPETVLRQGDIVVLRGAAEEILRAEARLLGE